MIAVLNYSIPSNFTEKERIQIDKQVAENRKAVCVFIKSFPSNAKRKTKKVIPIVIFGGGLIFGDPAKGRAIPIPLPPVPVVKVEPTLSLNKALKNPEIVQ